MEKIDFKKERYDADLIIGAYELKRNTSCDLLQRWLDAIGDIAPKMPKI